MRTATCTLLILTLAIGVQSAAAQTFKYVAFGDSITCGKYDNPNICSGSGPVNALSTTGYPGRLRSQLGCTGGASSCQVYNYGDPGEAVTSPAELTRLQNVLADGNGPYDILLLMHGTNDKFGGTSNAAIKFDLQVMDDKAALVGVDTVFASIIRFDPSGSAWSSSKESQIADLRNDLSSIAAARDSWFADPWAVLCPTTQCFTDHYTNSDGGLGLHPDNTGYNILADEFEDAVTQQNAPGTPGAQTPDGNTASTTATWSSADRANWYQIDWDSGGGSQWVAAASVCAGSSCSWTIPGLGPGDHTWSVRGRNPNGRGNPSGTKSFHLFTAAPPVPSAVSPITDFYDTPPTEFTWTEEAPPTNGATGYQLKVERDGIEVFNADVPVPPSCTGGNCSHDPGLTWTPATYAWQVRSENPAGDSAWSSETEFVFTDVKPDVPVALEPSVDTFDTTPVFIWTPEFGAKDYRIQVFDDSSAMVVDETLSAATVCSGTRCSWDSTTTLAVEDHTWKVRAENPIGSSTYSATIGFTVLACSPPTDPVFSSGTVNGPAQEAACNSITAEGTYEVGSTGDLELHAGDKIIFNASFSVESGGTLRCRVDP